MEFQDLEVVFYERDIYGNPKHEYLYPNIVGNFFTRALCCYITYKGFVAYIWKNSDKATLDSWEFVPNFSVDYMKKDELGKPIHSAPFWEKNLSEVVEIIKEKLKEEIESLQEQYKTCFDGFEKRGTKLGELMMENVKLRNKTRLQEVLEWLDKTTVDDTDCCGHPVISFTCFDSKEQMLQSFKKQFNIE